MSKLDEIAKDNAFYCPAQRNAGFDKLSNTIKNEANRHWAYRCFSFHYFYDIENKLLGMFGVYDQIASLFDTTIIFQNSCDQDYDFKTWQNIEIFRNIAQKYINTSDETIEKIFKEKHNCDFRKEYNKLNHTDFKEQYDYYRRSFAYDEIWTILESELYNSDKAVYLNLFSDPDIHIMSKFVRKCEKHAEKILNDESE